MKLYYPYSTLVIMIFVLFNKGIVIGQLNPDVKNLPSTNEIQSSENFGNLVWFDEFELAGAIDTSKWFHQTKLPNGSSWYNNEIQHYTDRIDNSFNDSGYMHILAKKEEYTDQGITKQYTSARLNSKFAFTYGKVEIRAILPSGVGTWPAMWTLGKNITENGAYWQTLGYGTTGWPGCGEIDIMEHWGTNQNYVSSAIHTPSSYGNTVNKGGRFVPTASTDFHTYCFEWTPEKLVFSIDTVEHYTYKPAEKNASTWPFDEDQYLLLNIAIQAGIADEFTESAMIVDYVRVYEYVPTSFGQDRGKREVKIYPNPVADKITIELFDPVSTIIDVHSLGGQLISSTRMLGNSQDLDLSSFKTGVYLLRIKSKDFVRTEKFLKL